MRDIYTKQDIVRTYVDGKIIKVIWDQLSVKSTLYESCQRQLEEIQKGDVQVIIIDVSKASGTPPMEVQKWFGEVLFPGFKACAQFKGLINVLPSSAISKMGAKRWKEQAESAQFGFMVLETDSFESAEIAANEMINSSNLKAG